MFISKEKRRASVMVDSTSKETIRACLRRRYGQHTGDKITHGILHNLRQSSLKDLHNFRVCDDSDFEASAAFQAVYEECDSSSMTFEGEVEVDDAGSPRIFLFGFDLKSGS